MNTFAPSSVTPLCQWGAGGIPVTQIPSRSAFSKGGVGLLLLALSSFPALAHDLHHEVSAAQAVVLRLYYADAKPFSFEGYEVYRGEEKLPYQVGRTDAQGRLAFLPDRTGAWRIKAFSEDGHGLDVRIDANAASAPVSNQQPLIERYGRIAAGVGVILGVFGFLSLYLRKRKP